LVGGNRRQISASRAASPCGSCHKRTSCDITLENFSYFPPV